jgi:hypothetical protein
VAGEPKTRPGLTLRCSTHGSVQWSGEVVCVECQSVWKLTDPKKSPPGKGSKCTCDADLRESARSICARCYEERASK